MVQPVKTKLLSYLAAAAAFLTVLAGLDLSGIVHAMPDTWATGIATILPTLAGLVHFMRAVGDFADDGQFNGSFKCPALLFVLALVVSLMATSCVPSAVWSIRTPYGDAHSDDDGGFTVIPKPIVVPSK